MVTRLKTIQRKGALLLLPSLLVTLAAGCGSDQTTDSGGKKEAAPNPNSIYNNKPVTIKVRANADTEEVWQRYTVEPVKKKFPHVTLELIPTKLSLADLVAANEVPDILQTQPSEYVRLVDMALPYDLTELIKKHKTDMNRFTPSMVDAVKSLDKNGRFTAIPFRPTRYGLLYNKNVFDKFAVPYPTDGMTWDQTVELAKRVTRSENGVQYRGLDILEPHRLFTQLSLNPIVGEKAVVTTPAWQTAAEMWQRVLAIPGNSNNFGNDINKLFDSFSSGEVAMLASSVGIPRMITISEKVPDLRWDVVSFPTFKEAPATDTGRNYQLYVITSTSKVKDEAFEVISYLMSDEVQMALSRDGYITSLNNKGIQNALAADVAVLKNKNLASLFKYDKAGAYVVSPYFIGNVPSLLNNAFVKIGSGQQDINTALREAEEAMNKAVQEQLKK